MPQKIERGRVAVLGLGLTGVATVKNLVEIGFDAVGFERSEWIGGLWRWSADETHTTVTKITKANISKQRGAYHDFPFPDDVPDYPPASQVAEYIESYAAHFNLNDRFRLGRKVDRVERSEDGKQWVVKTTHAKSGSSVDYFDRVIVTTGPFHTAHIPRIEGIENFKGRVLHAQGFKDVQEFVGKRVIVVGLCNTGCDVAVEVASEAKKVYMSHRAGGRIMSRGKNGAPPADWGISRRMAKFGQTFSQYLPTLATKLAGHAIGRMMIKGNPGYQKSWGLLPAAAVTSSQPVVNDHIIDRFIDGTIIPTKGLKRFLLSSDPNATSSSVELVDNTILESIDAVIFATGYYPDFSICAPEADPTAFDTPEWDSSLHKNDLAYPRLFRGIFSTVHPDSLAFIGPYRGHSFAGFSNADLTSQAIVQIWAGNYSLPPQVEMEAWCDNNYRDSLKQISMRRIGKITSDPKAYEVWLNDAAGNEVNEKLGWGLEGWKFWWNDRKLYNLLVDGIDLPYLYRLFDGREGSRLKYEGARDAIFRVNKEIKEKSARHKKKK